MLVLVLVLGEVAVIVEFGFFGGLGMVWGGLCGLGWGSDGL